jgi:AcrR family transcriptional regulator
MTTDHAQAGREAEHGPAGRGESTREALLNAAREVFVLEGYSRASVTGIVTLAGASVGSLYHHFTGKADLYFALFEQLQHEQDARTRRAIRETRAAGVTDPMRLLLAGARGYLYVCVEQRELMGIFASSDGPPGFGRIWGSRLSAWVARNTRLFARSGEALDEAAGVLLTGALWLVAFEIGRAPDEARARQLADSALDVLSRLRIR